MGRGDHGSAPGLRSGTAPLHRTIRPTYCSMRHTLLQHQIQTSPKVKVNGKEASIGYMKFFRPGEKIGYPSLVCMQACMHACLPREVGFLLRIRDASFNTGGGTAGLVSKAMEYDKVTNGKGTVSS